MSNQQTARDLYAQGLGPSNPQASTANPYAQQQYISSTSGTAPGGGSTYDYGSTGFQALGQNQGGNTVTASGHANTGALNNYMSIAAANPAYAAMLQSMGISPTYNGAAVGPGGVANGGVPQRNVGGGVVYPKGSYGEYIQSGGTPSGWPAWQAAHAPGGAPAASAATSRTLTAAQIAPPQGGSFSGGFMQAHPNSGFVPVPARPGAGAPSGGPAGAPAGGMTGAMTAPGWKPPSAVGLNPLDPNSATAIQEANRNAAVAELEKFQQGVGGSALTRNLEGGAASLAGSAGPIDDATYQAMQSSLLESDAAAANAAQNAARSGLGAQGRLGSGAAPAMMGQLAMQAGQRRSADLANLMSSRATINQQAKVANTGAATQALGTIGNLGGATSAQIANVYNNSNYDDQALAKSLYGAMLGAGGGYGIAG